jgi:hypothetical protein
MASLTLDIAGLICALHGILRGAEFLADDVPVVFRRSGCRFYVPNSTDRLSMLSPFREQPASEHLALRSRARGGWIPQGVPRGTRCGKP